MPPKVRLIFAAWVGILLLAPVATTQSVPAQTTPAQTAPAQSTDAVEQEFLEFRPRQARTEADEDRILASTLFADGRLMFRREDYASALRQYQRAFRYSNGSSTILAEIVPLAFRIGHVDEAIRYALLAEPNCTIDPFILRRLAILLTEREQFADAATIYEKTVSLPEGRDLDGAAIVTRFEIGRLYFLTEDFDQAARSFDHVVKAMQTARKGSADGLAVEALLKNGEVTFSVMAESYLHANRLDEAEKYFAQAHEKDDQQALLAFHQARVAQKRDKFDSALRKLQLYFDAKEDAAGTAPYQLLESLLDHQGRSDELIERLERLRETQTENIYLAYYLANQYLASKRHEEAAKLYRHLLQAQPTVDAYQGLVRAYTHLDQDADLIRLLAKSVADLGNLNAIEASLTPLVEDPARLRGLLDQVRSDVAASPVKERRPVCAAMASLALKAKLIDDAHEFFELAAGDPPDADAQVWTSWGIEMLLADQHDRAVQIFQQMRDKRVGGRRSRGEVLFYLSGALAIQEKYDEALEVARQAARLSQGVPAIQVRPAWVLYLAQRWDDAKLAYREFLDQYGDHYGSTSVRALVREAKMTLSNICVQTGEHDEAIEWLEQILDEYPGDIGALNDLGYLWADRGLHLERSLRMARTAAEAEPDNVAYLDSVGWALFRLQRYDEAVEQLQKAAAGDQPDPIILDHLGDALLHSGDVTQARDAWQRAIEQLDENQQAERKRIETKLELHVQE